MIVNIRLVSRVTGNIFLRQTFIDVKRKLFLSSSVFSRINFPRRTLCSPFFVFSHSRSWKATRKFIYLCKYFMRFFSTNEKFPHESKPRSNHLLRSKQHKSYEKKNSTFLYRNKNLIKFWKHSRWENHFPFHSKLKRFFSLSKWEKQKFPLHL